LGVAALAYSSFSARKAFDSQPKSGSDPFQGLVVAPEELDVGELWEQDVARVKFHLHNPSQEPREIVRWKNSCTIQNIDPPNLTLAPGERRAVLVTVSTRHTVSEPLLAVRRPFAFQIVPVFSGEESGQ
jgi:hypothetical protein